MTTTAAAIDRLVHHSIILEVNLSSYRLEQSHKEQGTAAMKSRENPHKQPCREGSDAHNEPEQSG